MTGVAIVMMLCVFGTFLVSLRLYMDEKDKRITRYCALVSLSVSFVVSAIAWDAYTAHPLTIFVASIASQLSVMLHVQSINDLRSRYHFFRKLALLPSALAGSAWFLLPVWLIALTTLSKLSRPL